MELSVPQERLAKALNIVSRVSLHTKLTLPVLSNVLIRAEGKKLALTATNLEMATVHFLGAKVKKEGTITVPARLLAEFVSNLPKEVDVEMTAKDNKLTVKAGQYRSVMNGLAADDFPELPKIDEKKAVKFKVGVEDFRTATLEVIVASSNDTTRPALTGVYFNTSDGVLYMAATDGYRLAERKFVDKVVSEVFTIVPTVSMQEVLRTIMDDVEEVEILFDQSQVRFRVGEIELTSKIIDGSFPDYRQLIPKKTDITVTLEKEELIRMTKMAALFARQSGGSVVCETKKADKQFLLSAVASELGENTSYIDTEVSGDGKVVLNSRFLLDALGAVGEESLSFGFSGKLSPVVVQNVKNKDYTHIIMPLKS